MGRKSHDDEHALRLKAVMATRLRAARMALGLTQKAVAQEVGIKVRFVSSLENGDAFPSLKNLMKLANLLKVSVDHLFGNDDALAALDLQIAEIVERTRDHPERLRFVVDYLDYYERAGRHDTDEPDERESSTIDPAHLALAQSVWPRYMIDAAIKRSVDDIGSHLSFWRRVDQEVLKSVFCGDSGLNHLANYIDYMQGVENRMIVIRVILGMHPDERRALEPSVLGALLDHGFDAVSDALHSRLQEGDPHLLIRLRLAIKRSYSPRNSGRIFNAAHRREADAWERLLSVLLDQHIHPASILDALYTGIILHLGRGVDQGTIDVSRIVSTDLYLGVKDLNCHETVLLRAFRLLEIGY